MAAQTRIDEIAAGIYRISTWAGDETGITFNQFLVDDERPALIHTGTYPMYDRVRAAIREVVDPSRLEYVALLHFEADECGGMERFVSEAPGATIVASALSAALNLSGWDLRGRVQGFADGETLDLGAHRLRFLETPHVHHWDSMMLYEESTGSVFPADLYVQPGWQPPVVTEDLGTEMCAYYREIGIFAHEDPVRRVVDRLEALDPQWMHTMHGGTLARATIGRYSRSLRELDFAYADRLLGRRSDPNVAMLIRAAELDAIRAGRVDLAFRRWERPRLRIGTQMRTAIGLVEATAVDEVAVEAISDADAHRAGADSRDELLARLARHPERPVFRIGLRFAGPDPRVALRDQPALSETERAQLAVRLQRLDRASRHGAWTRATLAAIDRRPATRAVELAQELGRETPAFKRDVRKLKELGLTESLGTGYRLSRRGRAFVVSEESGQASRRSEHTAHRGLPSGHPVDPP